MTRRPVSGDEGEDEPGQRWPGSSESTNVGQRINDIRTGVASDVAGGLTEAFVAGELRRQLAGSASAPTLFHFRDRNGLEVDLVLADGQGRVAGIEVKAASTVRAGDFRGLAALRDRLGDQFRSGVVLHTGSRVLPFGDRLTALPLAALWSPAH